MKSPARPLFLSVLLALFLPVTAALLAQDATVAPAPPAAPANAPAPAEATKSEPVAPSEAPAADAAAAGEGTAVPATEVEAEKTEEKELRGIDEPVTEPTPERSRRRRANSGDEFPFGDHTVSKNSHVHNAVSLLGSTTVDGEVSTDAVSFFGDTTVSREAEVHGGAVAVMGKLDVQGRVHRHAVNVLGRASIDSHVGGKVFAVLSDLHLGPNTVIDGDLVIVGGSVTRDPAAVVNGNERRIPFFVGVGGFEGLSTWVKKCLLFGRPLAFDPNLMWAWWIALTFLGLYVVFALLFRSGVDTCVQTFETRPGSTIIAAVLTVLLAPVLTVLLVATMIGAVLVPFVGIALFFATLFGKAVVLAWLGRRITKAFGDGPLNHAAVAVLVGGIIVLLLYTVPFLGFVIYKLVGVLGLGVVVYTLILRSQREKVQAAATAMPSPAASAATAPGVFAGSTEGALPVAPFSTVGIGSAASGVATGPAAVPLAPPPPAVPMNTLPRAGFWIRTGALALDVILVAVVLGFVLGMLPRILGFHHGPGSMLPALAIYGAVMWKLKGTTIGGIICGLKVVRIDGREIDWATAIVRALACFLSLVVAGLGFIWVVIDDDKQSWHDKIAGTTVVRVPKGVALV